MENSRYKSPIRMEDFLEYSEEKTSSYHGVSNESMAEGFLKLSELMATGETIVHDFQIASRLEDSRAVKVLTIKFVEKETSR